MRVAVIAVLVVIWGHFAGFTFVRPFSGKRVYTVSPIQLTVASAASSAISPGASLPRRVQGSDWPVLGGVLVDGFGPLGAIAYCGLAAPPGGRSRSCVR
jgi:hypothetical protein